MMDQNFEIRILWFLRIFLNFQKGVARSLCGRSGPLWSRPNQIRVGSLWPSFVKIGQSWRVEVPVRHTHTQTDGQTERKADRQTRLKIRAIQVCNRANRPLTVW